jgi:hypothetical protein
MLCMQSMRATEESPLFPMERRFFAALRMTTEGVFQQTANAGIYLGLRGYLTIPSVFPTVPNAAMALSRWAVSCAADICVRMRAFPFGTTGKEKAIT